MSWIYVDFEGMNYINAGFSTAISQMCVLKSKYQRIVEGCDAELLYETEVSVAIEQISRALGKHIEALKQLQKGMTYAYNCYFALEAKRVAYQIEHTKNGKRLDVQSSDKYKYLESFWSEYGWAELLSGAGYMGTIYDFISDIREGKTWMDFIHMGVDVRQFCSSAAQTYKNYKKIGNIVGEKQAKEWWFKNITGLRPLGRASTAKKWTTRFKNNLTNQTSPFHAQWEGIVGDAKGINSKAAMGAFWGGVCIDGVANWYSNKEEQARSNGTMSDERVAAETITETAIGAVMGHGSEIVVGAAVTATLGTAAAPGVVLIAISGAVVAGFNTGVKALTGETATEWASDMILDTGENIIDSVGNAIAALTH